MGIYDVSIGWSLGSVQDRYIFAGAGGDQMVGRAASGLPINTVEFATLPPHFTLPDLDIINQLGWNKIVDNYDVLPNCFKRVVPFLLANIVYHHNFLRRNLPSNHPLWNQKSFTKKITHNGTSHRSIVELFIGRAVTGIMRHEEIYNTQSRIMIASGIPESCRYM